MCRLSLLCLQHRTAKEMCDTLISSPNWLIVTFEILTVLSSICAWRLPNQMWGWGRGTWPDALAFHISHPVHLWVLCASSATVIRSYTIAKCACISARLPAADLDVCLKAPGTMWVDVRWHYSQHLSALSCLARQAHEATDLLDICLLWPRLHAPC